MITYGTRREAVRSIIISRNRQPFQYGGHDCATLMMEIASRITGENVAPWIAYTSEDEARELIDDAGGLAELMMAAFGEPLEDVQGAQVGDPCMANLPGVGDLCAVVGAPGWLLVAGEVGVERIPARCLLQAWSLDGIPEPEAETSEEFEGAE